MTVRRVLSDIYVIESPISRRDLRQLGPRPCSIQFSQPLTEKDHARLGAWCDDHPGVKLRVYGNYNRSIRDLDFLKHYPNLRGFSVDSMRGTEAPLEDVEGLRHLPASVTALGLGIKLPPDTNLDHLARLASLESLTISDQRRLPGVIATFTGLRKLYIEGPVRDLKLVANCSELEDLTLRSVTADLAPLVPLRRLSSFALKLGGITDLHLLAEIGKLRYLGIWQVRGLSDVSVIGKLESLEHLFLQALRNVTTLPDLTRCKLLRRIELDTMKGLTDLLSLRTAPALEELRIIDARHLELNDLHPLVGHPTLQRARIGLGSKHRNAAVRDLLDLADCE